MFIVEELSVGAEVRELCGNVVSINIESIDAGDVLAVVDLILLFLVGLIFGIIDRACVFMY